MPYESFRRVLLRNAFIDMSSVKSSFPRCFSKIRYVFCVLPILLLTACQSADINGGISGKRPFISSPALKVQNNPEQATTSSAVWVLGQQDDALWAFDTAGKNQNVRIGPVEPTATVVQPRLDSRGDTLVVLWQEVFTDQQGKRHQSVLGRISRDGGLSYGQAFALGHNERIVANADLAFDSNDEPKLLVLEWDGEAKSASLYFYGQLSAGVQGVLVREGAKGEQISEIRLFARNDYVMAAWLSVNAVQVAESFDGGRIWYAGREVGSEERVAGLQLHGSADKVFLSWMGRNGGLNLWSYQGGNSDGHALRNLPGQDEGEMAGYSVQLSPNGAVHLLYGWHDSAEGLIGLYHSVADDGETFTLPQRLSNGMAPGMASAEQPSMAFDNEGQRVLVVWHDARFFRRTVMGNVSLDGGKTWLHSDFAVSDEPGFQTSVNPVAGYMHDDVFAVSWTHSADTTLRELSTRTTLLHIDDIQQIALPKPDVSKLKPQINAYWKARMRGDHAATFPIYDPFYRERGTVDGHVKARTRFKVTIYDYAIGEMTEITPLRYVVKIRYEHEVEPFILKDGKEAKVPRDWVDTEQEWVWIDGSWHVLYKDLMKKPIITY